MKKVNLGIIGLGFQGKIHLRNALHLKSAKVLGVSDASEEALRFARAKGVRNVCVNYEDLLKNEELDAVIIGLPNFLHLEASVQAAEAGKDILLEKPLARNVLEGEKILLSARKNGVKLMIGYAMRFSPILQRIREKIMEGIFGKIHIVDSTYVGGGPFTPRIGKAGPVPVPSWWFDKNLSGGGALLDLGSHMIDLLSWYFGEPDVIESYLGYTFNFEVEDVAACMLKFPNGPLSTVKVGWFSKDFVRSIQICGTAKNLLVNISPPNPLGVILKDVKSKFGWHNNNSFYLELEHFVRCLQKDEQPYPSGEDGLRCLQIISRAYEKALVEEV